MGSAIFKGDSKSYLDVETDLFKGSDVTLTFWLRLAKSVDDRAVLLVHA